MWSEDKAVELCQFFKSIIDQDQNPVVICDLEHVIIYANPAACSAYEKQGGEALLGKNVMDCHDNRSKMLLQIVADWFAKDKNNNKTHTFYEKDKNKDIYMVALRDDDGNLIGYYEKHESRTRETEDPYMSVVVEMGI